MGMTEKKLKAIEYIIKGERYTDVAKLAGISRQTLYHWFDDSEFKAELDRQIQEIRKQGEQRITTKLSQYIDALDKIALTGRSERERNDALQYLVNRVIGSPTARVADVTDKEQDNKDKIKPEELQNELDQFRDMIDSKKQDKRKAE